MKMYCMWDLQFLSEANQCLPRKPLFHVILLKGQSQAPVPLDKRLTLLPVSGRPPVSKHVTYRTGHTHGRTVLRPFSVITSGRAPGGDWRMTNHSHEPHL